MPVFNKIINDFKIFTKDNYKIKNLCLFMFGEPFLNKSIFQMIKKVKDSDIANTISISTNGSLLSKKVCEEILVSGLDVLSISMYGCSNDDYAEVTSDHSFDEILSNSKMLIKLREKQCSITPPKPLVLLKYFKNDEKVSSIRELLLPCCDNIAFEAPFNWNSTFSKVTGKTIRINESEKSAAKYCSQPWYVMSIGWNGTCLVCCADWSWSTSIGNCMDVSIEEIWTGQEMLNFRRNIVEGRQNDNEACRGCNSYEVNGIDESNIDDLINKCPEKALRMR